MPPPPPGSYLYNIINSTYLGKRNENFVVLAAGILQHYYAAEKLKNFCSSSLWTCLHHIILRSQNKITDFLMILAWASLFKHKAKNLVVGYM